MKKAMFLLACLSLTGTVSAADQAVIDKYNKSCMACHSSGAAGAPKAHDAAAWAPRLEKGMDALAASVDKGFNAMPPKGLCMDCSADDYKALIEYMSRPQ